MSLETTRDRCLCTGRGPHVASVSAGYGPSGPAYRDVCIVCLAEYEACERGPDSRENLLSYAVPRYGEEAGKRYADAYLAYLAPTDTELMRASRVGQILADLWGVPTESLRAEQVDDDFVVWSEADRDLVFHGAFGLVMLARYEAEAPAP